MNHKYVPSLLLAAVIVLIGMSLGGFAVTPIVYPLILLACPLMMIWMMRGMHGNNGDHDSHHNDSAASG
jgi:hypothetical protein